MRQAITALLLALTLVLGLSGCTAKKDNGNNNSNNDSSYSDGNTNNGTKNGGTNSSDSYNNGSSYNNGTNNNNSSYKNDSNGSLGNELMDETEDLLRGRSYDEMLRNGRVHDTDGDLTDGENSVSR